MARKRDQSSDSSASSSSSSDEEDTKQKKSTKKVVSQKIIYSSDSSSSSEEEEWKSDSKPKPKRKAKKGRPAKKPAAKPSKKKKFEEREEGEVEDNDDDDDDDDNDEDEQPDKFNDQFNDGYDENLMGDEEDRQRLAKMTEKEREVELFNRSEKREAAKFRFEIQKKLRLQKLEFDAKKKSSEKPEKDKSLEVAAALAEPSSRSIERRRNVSGKRKVNDAIQGLKAEREKKKLKKLRAVDVYSDSSDSDSNSNSDAKPSKKASRQTSSSDSDSSSGSDDDSDAEVKPKSSSESRKRDDNWNRDRSSDQEQDSDQFNFSLEHLNSIRLSRFKMEKWVHLPFFKDTIIGCFVRVGTGASYMVGQIVDVVETSKVYLLGKTRTNKGIKLKHANRPEQVYRLEYVSNSNFTQEEHDKWYSRMVGERCDCPTLEFVERKKLQIQSALNHQFSDADVELIVAEKERFKDKPVNFAMKKSQLMKEKEFAEGNGEHDKAIELGREIDRLEDEAKRRDKIRTSNIAAISFINERNRMRNIKEAERAGEETATQAQITNDPFTRRKCAPTMISVFGKKPENAATSGDGKPAENETAEPNASNGGGDGGGNASAAATNEPKPAATKEEFKVPLPTALPSFSSSIKTMTGSKFGSDPFAQDSDDLFNAHNFDIKIDFDLVSNATPNSSSLSNSFLAGIANGKASNGFTDNRPTPIVSSGANRRSLNLEEYKKKKGLI